ncbi:MAG: ferritin-like domain-containing protein, partial [Alphaproteobacteria bacterium]|nr:ferritin-like domain-containing protein [Alphaproteobacteria bacterium]
LAEIARHIAADEFRHYKLFYDSLKLYLAKEQMGRLGRAKAAISRIRELDDDELAYAYYASNVSESVPYDRTACSNAYLGRIYPHYDTEIIRRSNAMILKAVGLTPHGRLNTVLTAGASRFVSYRANRLADAA